MATKMTTLEQAQAELNDVQVKYDQLTEKMEGITRQVKELNDEIYLWSVSGSASGYLNRVAEARRKISALEKEQDDLKAIQKDLQPLLQTARDMVARLKQEKAAEDYVNLTRDLIPKGMEVYKALDHVHVLLCQYRAEHKKATQAMNEMGNLSPQMPEDQLQVPESVWNAVNHALEVFGMANVSYTAKESIFKRLGLPYDVDRRGEYNGKEIKRK